jgi:hypothetical protein
MGGRSEDDRKNINLGNFLLEKFIYSKGDGIIDSFTESFLNVLTIITLLMVMDIFFTIF